MIEFYDSRVGKACYIQLFFDDLKEFELPIPVATT